MPVELVKGDLFESECQTIINAVNCVGKMGKGIALDFKKHFPRMYEDYTRRCGRNLVKIGQPYIWTDTTWAFEPYIINFPTVYHWRDQGRMDTIKKGLDYLKSKYKEWGVTSLALPALGCGCAGLSWQQVKPVLLEHFKDYDIPVKIYEPH